MDCGLRLLIYKAKFQTIKMHTHRSVCAKNSARCCTPQMSVCKKHIWLKYLKSTKYL